LISLFSSPQAFSDLPGALIDELLALLSAIISRPFPVIPKQWCCWLQTADLRDDNQQINLAADTLLQLCLRGVSPSRITTFLSDSVLRALLTCFDSPDPLEQSSNETTINTICELYADVFTQINSIALTRIDLYLSGTTPHYCVAPCLRLIASFYRSQTAYPSDFLWFQHRIVPLFSSDFLSAFYEPLDSLCDFFCPLFDGLPYTILKYILKHWPEMNPEKAPILLKRISASLPQLGKSQLSEVWRSVAFRFAASLESEHIASVTGAIQIVGERGFLGLFGAFGDEVCFIVSPPVDGLAQSQYPEVRSQAESVAEMLRSRRRSASRRGSEAEGAPPPEPEDRPDPAVERRRNWQAVVDLVRERCPDFPEISGSAFELAL
jgi:hypothetical protein